MGPIPMVLKTTSSWPNDAQDLPMRPLRSAECACAGLFRACREAALQSSRLDDFSRGQLRPRQPFAARLEVCPRGLKSWRAATCAHVGAVWRECRRWTRTSADVPSCPVPPPLGSPSDRLCGENLSASDPLAPTMMRLDAGAGRNRGLAASFLASSVGSARMSCARPPAGRAGNLTQDALELLEEPDLGRCSGVS
jgi:hypothetical protein